jgi:hypothetical protein
LRIIVVKLLIDSGEHPIRDRTTEPQDPESEAAQSQELPNKTALHVLIR